MSKARIFIDGQAGTTGLEISERLRLHPDVELLEVAADDRKKPEQRASCMAAADLTILCLPDSAVPEAVELAAGARLLDASSCHRTAAGWHYGLPELSAQQRSALRDARRVANPGCYPQGFILFIKPLIAAGWLPPTFPLTVHALSGFSGGGKALIETYTEQHRASPVGTAVAPRPYALDQGHKHLAEMQRFSGTGPTPVFSPAVGDYRQGMLVQIPLHTATFAAPGPASATRAAIEALLAERYADEPLISVHRLAQADPRQNGFLDPQALNETDRLELMVFGDHQHLLLAARYDNLGKGAAGAAVQNLNLMLGFKETTALRL